MSLPDLLSPLIQIFTHLSGWLEPRVGETAASPLAGLILLEAGALAVMPWLVLAMNGRVRGLMRRQDRLEERTEANGQLLQAMRHTVSDVSHRVHVLQTAAGVEIAAPAPPAEGEDASEESRGGASSRYDYCTPCKEIRLFRFSRCQSCGFHR